MIDLTLSFYLIQPCNYLTPIIVQSHIKVQLWQIKTQMNGKNNLAI